MLVMMACTAVLCVSDADISSLSTHLHWKLKQSHSLIRGSTPDGDKSIIYTGHKHLNNCDVIWNVLGVETSHSASH